MPSTAAAAMAAAGEQSLVFFLQPLFTHCISAGAHLILALAVAGRFLFRRLTLSDGRAKDGEARGDARRGVGGFRCYGIAVRTTWALAALEVLLAAFSWYAADAGAAAGWSRDAVAEQVDAAARAVAWLLLAAYLQFDFGRRHQERFPAPLRLWWVLFALLSVVAVGVHAAARLDGLPVPGRSWALDAVSVVAAAVLLAAGFLGRRAATLSPGSRPGTSSRPRVFVLAGAHAAADDNSSGAAETSLCAGAGFLSTLTFSWMAPLLAAGRTKTLGLDDVPGLEPGDSVAGVLPQFKANLEALTGDRDGGSSGRKVVTAFKLTKALLRTVWWHVAVTAFYALLYNVATYVGPYLIDSLVQYLNGDERYASKGQLLVLAFILAKVFECLSQRHWFFRLQQAGIRARSALVAEVYQKSLRLSSQSRRSRTNGEMINIISVDADRVGIFA